MEWAWVKVVAAHESHRPGFAALECVDPVRTRQWLAKLPLDDTCSNPGYADLRYAAYSVVLADASMCRPAVLLDSGPLPGVRQTSVRSELYAIMRAITVDSQVVGVLL